jgi:hypothetical protein
MLAATWPTTLLVDAADDDAGLGGTSKVMPSGASMSTGWLNPRASAAGWGPEGLGAVAHADDLELLGEPVGHTDDHVAHQRAGEAVQRTVLPLVVGALDQQCRRPARP